MKNYTLYLCALLILGSCKQTGTEQQTEVKQEVTSTLKDVYKDAFLIGNAVNQEIASGEDKVSQNIILSQFNTITPESLVLSLLGMYIKRLTFQSDSQSSRYNFS